MRCSAESSTVGHVDPDGVVDREDNDSSRSGASARSSPMMSPDPCQRTFGSWTTERREVMVRALFLIGLAALTR